MDSIKTILQGVLRQQNLNSRLDLYRALEGWEDMVGARIARHCLPKTLRDDGILLVLVDSPAWMRQIRYLEKDIRKKVNDTIGQAAVAKIHFQVGEIAPYRKVLFKEASTPEWASGEIDSAAWARIEEHTAGLRDEQIKGQLQGFLSRQYQVLQYRKKIGPDHGRE